MQAGTIVCVFIIDILKITPEKNAESMPNRPRYLCPIAKSIIISSSTPSCILLLYFKGTSLYFGISLKKYNNFSGKNCLKTTSSKQAKVITENINHTQDIFELGGMAISSLFDKANTLSKKLLLKPIIIRQAYIIALFFISLTKTE